MSPRSPPLRDNRAGSGSTAAGVDSTSQCGGGRAGTQRRRGGAGACSTARGWRIKGRGSGRGGGLCRLPQGAPECEAARGDLTAGAGVAPLPGGFNGRGDSLGCACGRYRLLMHDLFSHSTCESIHLVCVFTGPFYYLRTSWFLGLKT